MKSLNNYITEAKNVHGINEGRAVLVSTRNSECSILLGESMDEPYDEATVKKICKDMGINFAPIKDFDFDDMDPEDYLAGAVIEEGELIWYDLLDGTVDLYKIK